MKHLKNVLFTILCCFSILAKAQNPIIATRNGQIEGLMNTDNSVSIFKGIPFASPPVGDLRWKAPQPVKNWDNIKQCIAFSASPMQNKPQPFYCWSEEFIARPEPLSEDCLYLNVWSSAKSSTEKQPVFLWIYGGGFNSGSANCAIYDGQEMAKKGVIFVSINYRVGVFGFLAHTELSKESGYNASGNYGFLDQLAALNWVKNNIAAFGGDPKNITIAGQSAGSFSVNALIASPLAKGLFHKAILQSGGLLANLQAQNLLSAEAKGVRFMNKADAKSISDLRKKTAEEIQKLSNSHSEGGFGITIDEYVLPIDLLGHFKNGMHNKTPILAGWVTGDGSFMGESEMSVEEFKNEAQVKYGSKSRAFLRIFSANTPQEVKSAKQKLALLNFAGYPSHLLAYYNSKKTYLYQIGHVPPEKVNFPNYGAFHTSEVPYVLHNLHTWNRPWQEIDKQIENTLSSYWVNFAKTGDPNGINLPEWKNYKKKSGHILVVDDTISTKPAFFKKAFDFFDLK